MRKKLWVIAAGIGFWLLIVLLQNVIAPSPRRTFANCISASIPRSVQILEFQTRRRSGQGPETFLYFTVESNAFNRLTQNGGFGEVDEKALAGYPVPQFFQSWRKQKEVHLRLKKRRWLLVGPQRTEKEFLLRDETGTNAWYYHFREK